MKTRNLVALTLIVAVFAQASAQKYDLSPRFKAGITTMYDIAFRIDGMGVNMVYKSKLENEIIDIKSNGDYITASTQTDHQLFVDGKEEASPAEELIEVTTYDKLGKPLQMGGDMDSSETFRLANLTSFLAPAKPVAVNDKWEVEIAADSSKNVRKVTHSYHFIRVMKLGGFEVAEIALIVKETSDDHPSIVLGKVWVNVKTGETIKYQVEVKDLPVGPNYIDGGVLIEMSKPTS